MKEGIAYGGICRFFTTERAVSFRLKLQHYFNPLHIYCRLCEAGVSSRLAYRLCGVYERLYRLFGVRVPDCPSRKPLRP